MVNYDAFSSTFAESRKNMKWPEIEYFIELLKNTKLPPCEGGIKGGLEIEKQTPLTPLHRGGLKILDVGCGSGRFFGELKKAHIDCEYLGVDNSAGMIDEAKKAHPKGKFQVLDMLDIYTLDMKFDAIFLLASFHHLETEVERIAVLQKLKNILAKNGTIYMTNWNLLSEENMRRYEAMYR